MRSEVQVTGRLENWRFDPFFPVIWGNIYGDINERFFDGQFIHTSKISLDELKKAKEGVIVSTLNSFYLLGKPHLSGKPAEDV